MKEELQLELVKKYPKILKNFGGDPMHTCMAFGIEVESGWYKLLDECMEKLQYFCDLCFYKSGRQVQVVADQIKEKYGDLRFYVSVYDADKIEDSIIDDIIYEAERKSRNTCEVTGENGVLCKRGGWIKILCREEARKHGYVACCEETEKYWKSKDEKEANS
jgi:hypothetical protein